jgi:hypothetical protein
MKMGGLRVALFHVGVNRFFTPFCLTCVAKPVGGSGKTGILA